MTASGHASELLHALCGYGLSPNASAVCRAGPAASVSAGSLRPGAIEAASLCLMVVRSMAASDVGSALQLCRGTAVLSVLQAIRSPYLRNAHPHDGRLLLPSLDLLCTLSASDAAPTWPLIVQHALACGGVPTLLELLATAPATLLPLVLTLRLDALPRAVLRLSRCSARGRRRMRTRTRRRSCARPRTATSVRRRSASSTPAARRRALTAHVAP